MKEGRALRKRFMDNTPALKKLTDAVKHKAKTEGTLKGLDGRTLYCRSQHSALNLLLQSAGALLMKTATVILADLCAGAGLTRPDDWALVAHVHDEFQIECLDEAAPLIATTAVKAIHQAGYAFSFNMPLDGEATIGENWWQTH